MKDENNTVDKEKILKQFESGEIKIALTEEQEKQLYNSLPFKQSRAEYEFIKKALEKQIPKKPITVRFPFSLCCPVCNSPVGFYSDFLTEDAIIKLKYCAGCGQAIDWSE